MVKIKRQIISATNYKNGTNNPAKYITLHMTGNTSPGADAQAHANLQSNGNTRDASWHWQVDDKEAIQSFNHYMKLWHASDGQGSGNNESIGIEGCVSLTRLNALYISSSVISCMYVFSWLIWSKLILKSFGRFFNVSN